MTFKTIDTPEVLKYQKYPEKRLVASDTQSLVTINYTLPDGEWSVSQNFGCPLPSQQEKMAFEQQGIRLDNLGRPLHPNLVDMITDTNRGVVTGKGYFYNWGPNYTADAMVVDVSEEEPHVALIQRGDNAKWAFMGGFVDESESSIVAAAREANEETNGDVIVNPKNMIKIIYQGVQMLDPRSTAHAWIHTTAVLWEVNQRFDFGYADDAVGSKWQGFSGLKDVISPSHLALADKLLSHYNY